jgi:hypothetical protein
MIPKELVIEVFTEPGEKDIFDLISETGLYIAGCAKKEEAEAIKLRYNAFADQQKTIKQLVEALGCAANRLNFLTNWLENTYKGASTDIELGREYAKAARDVLAAVGKK